jgi:hypothetical protein
MAVTGELNIPGNLHMSQNVPCKNEPEALRVHQRDINSWIASDVPLHNARRAEYRSESLERTATRDSFMEIVNQGPYFLFCPTTRCGVE